jgi:DNA-binding HxlR family transcriptional regulator
MFNMNRIARELCPRVEAAFTLLATKWTALVVFSLTEGELRFSEIEAAIPGLSSRLLSLRMRELEESGLIERHVYTEESPIKVGYMLTGRGRSLAAILGEIADWATNY